MISGQRTEAKRRSEKVESAGKAEENAPRDIVRMRVNKSLRNGQWRDVQREERVMNCANDEERKRRRRARS